MKFSYLFYFCDSVGSVFDSQVLALLESISKTGQFKSIYLFLGIKNEIQKNDFLRRKSFHGINVVFFKSYPNYPFFNIMNRRSIRKALNNLNINLEEVIFHTRGELIAHHLFKIAGSNYYLNVIPDVRGASIEEIEEFSGFNKISKLLKIYNYKIALKNLKKSGRISVVSESLKNYLDTKIHIDPAKVVVTPCLAGSDFRYNEDQRDRIRIEFNLLSDDTLIVFSSGGTASWQNNDAVIAFAEKGLKVLNLSKKKIDHHNVFNKFVDYSDMPAYLNAADIAIIWRDQSMVNKVASPVKFSEYICCGLPVIANNAVDMITEFVAKYNCGVIIRSFDDLNMNMLHNLKQEDRKIISEPGILTFGINAIVNKYLQVYNQ